MCWVQTRGKILLFPFRDLSGPFVLDASAIINILGTGAARTILNLLPTPVIAEQTALREVMRHPIADADHAAELAALQKAGQLISHSMNAAGLEIFRALTANDLSGGLDDGEAATIAYAVTHSKMAVPVIDERKAVRIFSTSWQGRPAIGTLDLLTHNRVVAGVTKSELKEAIYSALFHARMRVPCDYRAWVVEIVGRGRASRCPSLGPMRKV
jgi:predicted nucleic acid-binding protein